MGGFAGRGALNTKAVALSGTPAKVLDPKPFRAGLLIQNLGAAGEDVYLSENPSVATAGATVGFVIKGGSTPPAVFSDVTITGVLYAVAAAGTPTIVVGEVS